MSVFFIHAHFYRVLLLLLLFLPPLYFALCSVCVIVWYVRTISYISVHTLGCSVYSMVFDALSTYFRITYQQKFIFRQPQQKKMQIFDSFTFLVFLFAMLAIKVIRLQMRRNCWNNFQSNRVDSFDNGDSANLPNISDSRYLEKSSLSQCKSTQLITSKSCQLSKILNLLESALELLKLIKNLLHPT